MAYTTSQLRNLWAPRCKGPWVRISLHGAGKVTVLPAIKDAVLALNQVLKAWDYRTRAHDTGAYNCRKSANGNWSLHAYGIAIDLNWSTNPYGKKLITDMPRGMVNDILAIRTNNGKRVWGWGGNWRGNKDAMHYEIICSPRDIATGINPRTVRGGSALPPAAPAPKPAPKPKPKGVKKVFLIQARGKDEVYITDLVTKSHVTSRKNLAVFQILLKSIGLEPKVGVLDASFVDSIPTNPSDPNKLKTIAGIINSIRGK